MYFVRCFNPSAENGKNGKNRKSESGESKRNKVSGEQWKYLIISPWLKSLSLFFGLISKIPWNLVKTWEMEKFQS